MCEYVCIIGKTFYVHDVGIARGVNPNSTSDALVARCGQELDGPLSHTRCVYLGHERPRKDVGGGRRSKRHATSTKGKCANCKKANG